MLHVFSDLALIVLYCVVSTTTVPVLSVCSLQVKLLFVGKGQTLTL